MDCSVIISGKKVSLANFISSIKGEKPKTPDIETNIKLEKLFDSTQQETNTPVDVKDLKDAVKIAQGKVKDNQTLLQQKQRAQQLYSQYLDTIFSDSKVKEIDDSLYNSVLNQLEQENKIEKDCTGGELKAKYGLVLPKIK